MMGVDLVFSAARSVLSCLVAVFGLVVIPAAVFWIWSIDEVRSFAWSANAPLVLPLSVASSIWMSFRVVLSLLAEPALTFVLVRSVSDVRNESICLHEIVLVAGEAVLDGGIDGFGFVCDLLSLLVLAALLLAELQPAIRIAPAPSTATVESVCLASALAPKGLVIDSLVMVIMDTQEERRLPHPKRAMFNSHSPA